MKHIIALNKKCPCLELFWSTYSRIRTLRIQSKYGKIRTLFAHYCLLLHPVLPEVTCLQVRTSESLPLFPSQEDW